MNNHPIGILDSGVGGLSVWQSIVRALPHESTVYLADSKNCPYGLKSPDQIYKLSKRLIEFLLEKQVKLIVIACNTISVTSLDKLRQEFPQVPILGIVPVIKTAVAVSKNKRIGILSTTATAKSRYQQQLINQFAPGCEVITVGADSLVPFVERGETQTAELEAVLVVALAPFVKRGVDTVALGCSHFPFLKEGIARVLGENVTLLDSGDAVARHTKRVLEARGELSLANSPTHMFFSTAHNTNTYFSLLGGKIAESVHYVEL